MMDFRILGPLEARNEAGPVRLGGGRPRTVLAVLLLHPHEVVSAARLAQELWGEDAPDRSMKSVQVLISRLRSALGDVDAIATTPAGYRVRLRQGELDLEQFERLAAEGRRARVAGRPERAAALLREALALWRGPPLAELAFAAETQARVGGLEELHLTTVAERIDADLEAGRHAALIGELRQRVDADPASERLACQLMLALYRCGRQADALDACRRLRTCLASELGLDPGPELRLLEQRIRGHDAALEPAAPRAGAGPELPPPLRVEPATKFVGRVLERAALRSWREEARAARRIVLFDDEAGAGKTRLAAHTMRTAHAAGFAASWGASIEELSLPYGPWISVLSHLVDHAPDAVLERHVAEHGGELGRLTRTLEERVPHAPMPQCSDPELERHLLFAAVSGLLEAVCAERPLVLVLDDLQWADAQSLALLRYLLATTPHLPLLVLCTYRGSDVPTNHPMCAVLEVMDRLDDVRRVRLGGLAAVEVAELMANVAGHDIGAGGRRLAADIAEETGGNPFFVGQILRHLNETGAVERDGDGRWRVAASLAELGLPRDVHEVIVRRLARLGDDVQPILTVAAVIGRSFDLGVLERLVDVDEERLIALLMAATRRGVLVESTDAPARFSFAHALINHSLYATVGRTQRARMHCRVARTLEPVGDEPRGEQLAELAHHWGRTEDPAHDAKAIEYARLAGEHALAQLAPDAAVRWFTTALARDPHDGAQRCDVLCGLGEAQRRLGDGSFRDTLLEASAIAVRLRDPRRLTRAVLANTLGPFGAPGNRDVERVEMLRRALALAPAGWPSRPLMLAILGKELYYSADPKEGTELSAEALALAREADDRRELARVMAFTTAISPVTPLDSHAKLVGELTALGEDFDDPELCFRAANARFIFAMHSGDRAQLDDALALMLTLAGAIRQPILRWTALWAQSAHQMIAGDLGTAEALTRQARDLAAEHDRPEGGLVTFGQLLSIRTEQGRLRELAEQAEAIAAANPRIGLLRLTCAFIAAETGRTEEAAVVLAERAAKRFEFPFDRTRAFNLARCADIVLRLREHGHAQELYDLLLPFAAQFATPAGISSRGSIELNLGRLAHVLGRPQEAQRHLAAAHGAHVRLGAPLLQARSALAWAETLLGHDAEEAGELLRDARTLALEHGSPAIRGEVEAMLGSHAII